MAKANPIGDLADDLIRKFPGHTARGLARRLVGDSNQAITLEQARSVIRSRLGQNGKSNRREVRRDDLRRPARQPGQMVAMPASKAEAWNHHDFGVVGRVGILSDIHVPYHDERAVAAAVDHLRHAAVDGLLLNGDIADFYAISRYMKDPRQRDFKGELEAVRQFVAWIRQSFPAIPIAYKLGNHEERWQHWLWQHAPEISDEPCMSLSGWLHLDRHDITLVEEKRAVMLGRLPVLHGHEKGQGISAPVNQARGSFLRLHHTVLEGHGHRTSVHCEPNMFHEETTCWSTGCLCDLTPDYARYNKWNHGFAIVNVHDSGEFDVENLRIADGTVRTS
jgi:hypothetical protein